MENDATMREHRDWFRLVSVAVIDQQGGLIGVEVSCADFVLRLAKETDIALIKYHG